MGGFQFFGHLTYALIALSFLVKDILWLRVFSVVASASSMVFSYFAPATPMWLVIGWNGVFIAINAVRITILIRERMRISFSEDEQELYETIFSNMGAVEYMKLIRIAEWKNEGKGEILATEGMHLDSLILIYSGSAEVKSGEKHLALLGDGAFIGEMSFTTDQPASATVATCEPTRLIVWPKEELRRLLQRNPSMRSDLQAVLGTEMAKKLQRR